MHSNRTHNDQVKHPEHRKQRFSLRKFSFGAASILVGSLLFFGSSVSANETVSSEVTTSQEGLVTDDTSDTAEPEAPVAEEKVEETLAKEALAPAEEVKEEAPVAKETAETSEEAVKPAETSAPKLVTKEYKATNTVPTDPTNNAMPRPENEGASLVEGTGFRAGDSLVDGYSVSPNEIPEKLRKYLDRTPGRVNFGMLESYITDNVITLSHDIAANKSYATIFRKDGTMAETFEVTTTPTETNNDNYLYTGRKLGQDYAKVYNIGNFVRVENMFDVRKTDGKSRTGQLGTPNLYTLLMTSAVVPPYLNLDNMFYSGGREFNIQDVEAGITDFSKPGRQTQTIYHHILHTGEKIRENVTQVGISGDIYTTSEAGISDVYDKFNREDYDVIIPLNANGRIWLENGLRDNGQTFEYSYSGVGGYTETGEPLPNKTYKVKYTVVDIKTGLLSVEQSLDGVPLKVVERIPNKILETQNSPRGSYPNDVWRATGETVGYLYSLDAEGRQGSEFLVRFENPASQSFERNARTLGRLGEDEYLAPITMRSGFMRYSRDVYYYYTQEKAEVKFWELAPDESNDAQGTELADELITGVYGKGESAVTKAKVLAQTTKDVDAIIKKYTDQGYEVVLDEFNANPTFNATTASTSTVDYRYGPSGNIIKEEERQEANKKIINIKLRRKAQVGSVVVRYETEDGSDPNLKDPVNAKTDAPVNDAYNTESNREAEISKGGKTYVLVTNPDGTPKLKSGSEPERGTVTEGTKTVTYLYKLKPGNVIVNYEVEGTGEKLQDSVELKKGADAGTAYDATTEKPAEIVKDGKTYVLTAQPVKAGSASETGQVESNTTKEITYLYKLKEVVPTTEEVSEDKTITRTVSYVKKPSLDAPASTEETVAPTATNTVVYTRIGTRNKATGETTWNDWVLKNTPDNNDVLEGNALPTVNGYTAVKATEVINSTTLASTPERTTQDVTGIQPNSYDIVEKVIYTPTPKTGNVIVKYVNEAGEEIATPVNDTVEAEVNKPYDTTDYKPTTIVKDGKAYTFVKIKEDSAPENGNVKEGDTVVTYVYKVKEEPQPPVVVKQQAVVKYYDKTDNNKLLATSETVEGDTGKPIQDTAATPGKGSNVLETIKYFTDRGYKVVSNHFDATPIYDDVEGNVQEVPIVLEQTFEEIPPTGKVPGTPIHPTPEDPNTPIPGTPGYPEGVTEKDLTKKVTRVVRYWIGEVNGQKPEGAQFVDVEQEVTFTRKAIVNKVTGEFVKYTDWTSTDKTFDEVVSPELAGHTVDRAVVPSKLEPDTTADGTRYVEDVIYTPIAPKQGNVVVRYVDTEGNQIKDPATDTPNSPVGTPYNTGENTEERPEVIETEDGKRYVRVPKLTQGDEKGEVTEGTTTVTYVYKKVANWIPLIPGQPKEENPRNPYPFDPDKPEDPIKTPPTNPKTDEPNVPYVPGYTPNDPNGNPLKPVDPDDPTKGYTPPAPKAPGEDTEIPYVKDPVPPAPAPKQEADLTFFVKNPDGSKTPISSIPVEEATGKDGEKIVFPGYTPNLEDLILKGYEVVEDDYKNRGNFDNDPNEKQHFNVVVTPKITPITPDKPGKPGEPIDPDNPDGPKWPEDKGVTDVKRTINRKTQYVKEDGDTFTVLDDLEKNTSVEYTRRGTINHVTGEVVFEDWAAKDDDTELDGNKLPFIKGYVAVVAYDVKTEKGIELDATTKGIPTTPESKDVHEVVVYRKLSEWVPKIPGEPNPPKLPYPNDPKEDPEKPGTPTDPGVPPIPHVPGYTPKDPNGNPLTPVDPEDPTKGYIPPTPTNPFEPIEIPYEKDPDPVKEGRVVVEYRDTEGRPLKDPVEDTPLSKVGTSYTTTDNRPEEITVGGNRYVRVPKLTTGKETGEVVEGTTTITYVYQKVANWIPLIPGEPKPPVNPYPFDPEKPTDPIKTPPTNPGGTPNVPYVPGYTPNDPNGNPLVPVDPKDPNKGYVPPVPEKPGEDTYIPYVPNKVGRVVVEYKDTDGNTISSPVVDTPDADVDTPYNTTDNRPEEFNINGTRYVRVPKLTEGAEDGKVVEGTTTVVYVYQKVANWIPLIPGEPNPPKNPYPFDPETPTDPIKTPPTNPGGTPNVPYVPDHVPNDPDGNPLVPVDPKDPNKGYIPPVPKNPGEDTFIPYVPVGTVVVEYRDTDGNPLKDPVLDTPESKVGTSYTTTDNRPEELTDKDGNRYVRVPLLTKGNEDGEVVQGKTTVVYVYQKVANWIPLIPGEPNPPKNPYPFNPDKPFDPIKTPPTTPDGTPNVPYVPGYTPKDPNGKPLKPVDPKDPSKGYIPPVPKNPGEDTPIPYEKDPVPPTPGIPGVLIPSEPGEPTPKPEPKPEPAPAPQPEPTPAPAPAPQPEPVKELPNTGDAGSVAATAFGLGSLFSALGLIAPRRRKKD